MAKRALAAASLVLIGAGWWAWSRRAADTVTGGDASSSSFLSLDSAGEAFDLSGALSSLGGTVQTVVESVASAVTPGPWKPPARAEPYLPAVYAAEDRYGIPRGLLARLIYQESRYRPEIINGGPNSAGAVGIAQIIPRWHPDVDAHDPFASIDYAGKFLAQLYRQFGTWSLALAAYNWGPGNLSQKGFGSAPLETRNYVSQITGDTGYA